MAMYTSSSMKPTKKQVATIRSITLAAMLLAILVAQEELLILIPNVSFTPLLIMVYAAVLPLSISSTIVAGYVLLDNIIMGSLIPVYFVPMLLSWLLLNLVAYLIKKKPLYVQVIVGLVFAVVYGWSFVPGNMIVQSHFQLWPYILADLPAEGIMALSNVVTIVFLYMPLVRLLQQFFNNNHEINTKNT